MLEPLSMGKLASLRDVDNFLTGVLANYPGLYSQVNQLRKCLQVEREKELQGMPPLSDAEISLLRKDKIAAIKMYYDRLRNCGYSLVDAKDKVEHWQANAHSVPQASIPPMNDDPFWKL